MNLSGIQPALDGSNFLLAYRYLIIRVALEMYAQFALEPGGESVNGRCPYYILAVYAHKALRIQLGFNLIKGHSNLMTLA